MEIRIGIVNTQRELSLETDESSESIQKLIRDALADDATVVLTDRRDRQVLVPADKLAYVEFGDPRERRVGFAAD